MRNFVTATGTPVGTVAFTANATLSPLELQVLRLAQGHGERPGKAPRRRTLADPRLEALRSYVTARRFGKAPSDVPMRQHGFTPAQLAAVDALVRPVRVPARDRMMYGAGVALGAASMAGFVAITGVMFAAM